MKRAWVGVFGGLLIAGQVAASDPYAKKRISIVEVPPQATEEAAAIQAADTVHVRVGSGNVLSFPSRVLRVAVGDEKIVALHVVESRQVLLQGLIAGRSTVFVWLEDGRRLRYDLIVSPRVEVLENALHDLDPRIVVDAGPDGSTLLLSGKVEDEHVANQARQLAETMLGTSPGNVSRVVNLLQFPGSNDADLRLTVALAAVDPRIRLRRMQVGNKVSNAADAVVLEGRVKDIPSLVRAITLAELQLGGVGGRIEPLSNEQAQSGRNRNFSGSGGLQRLQGNDAPVSGLAAYVARGLILKSSSGRVLSFLEVDELPQIMVSIRVLQVDRGRAKHLGIDYRLDGTDFSVGSFHQPGRTSLVAPAVPPAKQTIAGILGGNVVGTFVTKSLAVAAAIDFLQQKDVARSVAEPNITTLSGESASVLIGGEVPIPTTTVGTTASVQGFLFQDFGVRLDIRPTLAPSGLVAMEISPSIIRPSSDLAVSGVPGFQVQSVQTTAKVAPGQTLVLGGLISFNDEVQKRGVPGLSEIPLMKHLFSWEGRTLSEQEILFVITPRILAEGPDQVAEAIQWRDVEAITPGTVVELPAADLNTTANIESVTLGRDGLPPSFTRSGRRPKSGSNPNVIEDQAPPPPPPLPPSVFNNAAPAPASDPWPLNAIESRAAVTSAPEPVNPPVKETSIPTAKKTNVAPMQSSVEKAAAPPPSQSAAKTDSVPTKNVPASGSGSPEAAATPTYTQAVTAAPSAALPPASQSPATASTPVSAESAANHWTASPLPTSSQSATTSQSLPAKTLDTKPAAPAPKSPSSPPVHPQSDTQSAVASRSMDQKPAVTASSKVTDQAPATPVISRTPDSKTTSPAISEAVVKREPLPTPTPTPTTKSASAQITKNTSTATTSAPVARPTPLPVSNAPLPSMASKLPEKASPPTAHAASPSASSALVTKKPEPLVTAAPQPARPLPAAATPPQVAAAQPRRTDTPTPSVSRQPFNPPAATTAAAKKSEPSPTPASTQSVRSVTSGPKPTPPPAAAASKPSGDFSHTSTSSPQNSIAASVKTTPQPLSKPVAAPVPMPVTTVHPTQVTRESEKPLPPISSTRGALASTKVNDEIRAWLTKDYRIEVVVSPHEGDAWTRLAKRVTGDARHWQEIARLNGADENLTSEAHVHVPFEMLKPSLQQEITDKLLPKGSAAESDWKRMAGQH